MGAKNGHADSCCLVGTFYYDGTTVKQDYKEAMKWYKKCAALGNTNCLFNMGQMYWKALGVKRNYKSALECLRSLSDKEDSRDSFFIMGEIYQEGGDDVPQNSQVACKFYEKAFRLGNPMAGTKIAAIHCKGLGIEKNKEKATEWLRKAALKGFYIASALI